MNSRNVADAEARRRNLCGTQAAPDPISRLLHIDPDKAAVMNWIGELVAEGWAEWGLADDGNLRLCFNTGETFLLAKTGFIRLS